MRRGRKPKPCGVCRCRIRPGEDVAYLDGVGRVHGECKDDIERAIEDGGCDRTRYLETFGAAMGED